MADGTGTPGYGVGGVVRLSVTTVFGCGVLRAGPAELRVVRVVPMERVVQVERAVQALWVER